MRATLTIVALAVLALVGCATPAGGDNDQEAPVTEITGEWQLTKASDADGAMTVNGTPVTLVVADGRFSGQAPCNSFSAEATVDGTDVSVGSITSTRMACVDERRTELENRYLAALGKVTTAKPGGAAELRTLTLTGPDETLLFTFVEKKSAN
jgi:heat shock protein HslJ